MEKVKKNESQTRHDLTIQKGSSTDLAYKSLILSQMLNFTSIRVKRIIIPKILRMLVIIYDSHRDGCICPYVEMYIGEFLLCQIYRTMYFTSDYSNS